MIEEIWKEIPNTEGLYKASNLGNIKSNIWYQNKRRRGPGKGEPWLYESIIKGVLNRDGYVKVGLWVNNKKLYRVAHRLVAQTWIPNPDNYEIVHHKNGIRNDNRVENLEWCTIKYNGQLNNKLHDKFDLKKYLLEYIKDNNISTLKELLDNL